MSSNKLMDLLKQKRAQAARTDTVKPEIGRNRYRILPSWILVDGKVDPDAKFWAEWGQHFIKDAGGKMLAVYMCTDKTYGKPCDICAAIESGIRGAGDDAMIKQLTEAKSTARVLLNALWLNNGGKKPEGEPVILEVPPTVFAGHKGVGGIASLIEEWGTDMISLEKGREIIVERSGTGKDTRYGVQIAAGDPKPLSAEIAAKLNNLDLFIAQESEQQRLRALTSIGVVTGRPYTALPAPARTEAPVPAANLDKAQDEALKAIEGTSTRVADTAPAASAPAAAATPNPAPAAPQAAPTAAASNDDAELDDLLSSLA